MMLPLARLSAQPRPGALPTLTSPRAVHRLSMSEAARGYPVLLHATVTYYDPYLDFPQPILMVADATGSVFVKLPPRTTVPLRAGEVVEVRGRSVPGGFAPDVDHPQIRVIRESHLPAYAPVRSLTYLLSGGEDAPWVEMEGVVHAVQLSEHNAILKIAGDGGVFTAVTVREPGSDYHHLINDRVRIRGIACSLFNKRRQIVGVQLRFAGLGMVRVLEEKPENPYDLPLSRPGNLLSFQPGQTSGHMVRVRGTVTLFWPGRLLCVQDKNDGGGHDGLCVQTAETGALSPGQVVDVIGFPEIGNYTPTLSDSVYRLVPGRVVPGLDPPAIATVGAEQASSGSEDARLVRIEGRIIGRDTGADDPTIVLSSGSFIFSASLPRSATLEDTRRLLALEEGSLLGITGINSMRVDQRGATDPDGYTVAKSFRILLRSSRDVAVLRRPSWWNTKHTLWLLALALVVTLGVLAWVLALRKRLERQTELLQFQATHDGLTGLWNRRAILEMLRRERELGARSGRGVGLMMLDADHFKKINDTYGHPGGDLVLQTIAKRLRESVRSTELIGRYGGEEFLVLLPDNDPDRVAMIAERVRGAMADTPVRIGAVEVQITVSIGTAVLEPLSHQDETEALAAADSALYEAKRAGRNRVIASRVEVGPAATSQ
jgi:diguanylate cyclase (GGDEF)-like protein